MQSFVQLNQLISILVLVIKEKPACASHFSQSETCQFNRNCLIHVISCMAFHVRYNYMTCADYCKLTNQVTRERATSLALLLESKLHLSLRAPASDIIRC